MGNTIQIKRGTAAGLNGTGSDGEPKWTTDTFRLYILQGGVAKLVGEADFLKMTGGTMSGAIAMGTNKVTGCGDPSAAQDVATKYYVDSVASGLDVKASCRLATIAALSPTCTAAGHEAGKTLTATGVGTLTVDGVLTALNDRILVKNQATGADNGIYKVTTAGSAGAAYVLTRATDADTDAKVTPGMFTFIEEGGTYADCGLVLTNDSAVTVDSTALTFSQFTGAGAITAGNGLTKSGNTLHVGDGTSYAVGDILYASSASGLSKLADVAAGSFLRSGGVTTAPAWSTLVLPNAATAGDIPYATGANTYGNLAKGTAYQSLNMNSGATAPAYMDSLQSLMTTTGDIVQASAANTPVRLAAVATGNALISGGVGTVSSWGKVGLTTHISGTLGAANGGTGVANSAGSTITLGGALTLSGAFTTTLTVTGNTSVTLPTSGTLATTAQTHTQNTDTGTTSATFQILSGTSGPILKASSNGGLTLRHHDDAGNEDLKVASLYIQNSYGSTGYISLQGSPGSSGYIASFPNLTGNVLLDVSIIDGGTW